VKRREGGSPASHIAISWSRRTRTQEASCSGLCCIRDIGADQIIEKRICQEHIMACLYKGLSRRSRRETIWRLEEESDNWQERVFGDPCPCGEIHWVCNNLSLEVRQKKQMNLPKRHIGYCWHIALKVSLSLQLMTVHSSPSTN